MTQLMPLTDRTTYELRCMLTEARRWASSSRISQFHREAEETLCQRIEGILKARGDGA